jgi:hypothetical protein
MYIKCETQANIAKRTKKSYNFYIFFEIPVIVVVPKYLYLNKLVQNTNEVSIS